MFKYWFIFLFKNEQKITYIPFFVKEIFQDLTKTQNLDFMKN